MKRIVLVALAMVCCFTACKKDKSNSDVTVDRTYNLFVNAGISAKVDSEKSPNIYALKMYYDSQMDSLQNVYNGKTYVAKVANYSASDASADKAAVAALQTDIDAAKTALSTFVTNFNAQKEALKPNYNEAEKAGTYYAKYDLYLAVRYREDPTDATNFLYKPVYEYEDLKVDAAY